MREEHPGKANHRSVMVFADETCHEFYQLLSTEEETVAVFPLEGALENAYDCRARLVLIDCGFEINVGLNYLKILKKYNPKIIVILVTEASSEDTVIQAFRNGAREYIRKPVDIGEIRKIISELLKLMNSTMESCAVFVSEVIDAFSEDRRLLPRNLPRNLRKVLRFMEENIGRNIHLDDLANEINLSKYHFSRVFKAHIGMSPVEYLTFIRISRAKTLLERNELSVTEAGLAVGFRSHSAFIRGFRKHTGVTPMDYRTSVGAEDVH